MPQPIIETLEINESAARAKADQVRTSIGRYMVSAMLAGAYVGVAVVLLLLVSAPFIAAKSPTTKLVQGSVFGIALTLVVFAGAELFTGNLMVMVQGLTSKAVTGAEAALVWAASLAGNLLGSILFASVVAASGVVNAGAPKGQQTIFVSALAGIIKTKDSLTGGQLFFRAVLCNFLVCLALWMAARTKSDAAKVLVLWWALLAFVASGFEHSVANMTLMALGVFTHVDGATWAVLSRNLLYTVPGNVVGGLLLVGLAYAYVGRENDAGSSWRVFRLARPSEPEVVPVPDGPRRTTSPPSRTRAASKARAGNGSR